MSHSKRSPQISLQIYNYLDHLVRANFEAVARARTSYRLYCSAHHNIYENLSVTFVCCASFTLPVNVQKQFWDDLGIKIGRDYHDW